MNIREHDFADENVVLDFHAFSHCTFTRCNLVYNGLGAFSFADNRLTECSLTLSGPALATVNVLKQLHAVGGGFAPHVETLLRQIISH